MTKADKKFYFTDSENKRHSFATLQRALNAAIKYAESHKNFEIRVIEIGPVAEDGYNRHDLVFLCRFQPMGTFRVG